MSKVPPEIRSVRTPSVSSLQHPNPRGVEGPKNGSTLLKKPLSVFDESG
jgi:hypothetical protein